jgi:hypothetical protein
MTCAVAQMWYQFGLECVELAKTVYDNHGDTTKYKYDNRMRTAIIFPEDVDTWVKTYNIDMSSQ